MLVMEAIKYYQEQTKRRVTFEYGLFGGVNDQLEHARDLAHLIKNLNCHVNLIPVNPERNCVKTPKDDIFKFERIKEIRNQCYNKMNRDQTLMQRVVN